MSEVETVPRPLATLYPMTVDGDVWDPLPVVAARVGLKRTAIKKRIQDGAFPAPIRLSATRHVWSRRAIEAWMADVAAAAQSRHDPQRLQQLTEKATAARRARRDGHPEVVK